MHHQAQPAPTQLLAENRPNAAHSQKHHTPDGLSAKKSTIHRRYPTKSGYFMNIVAIANQKGGCGKTTTAINLAAGLGEKGLRTLLVDTDPQGHASLGLGQRKQDEPGLYEVFALDFPLAEAIIMNVTAGVDLVPATISLAAIEHVLADMPKRERQLADHLQAVESIYDFVIIDCPPSLSLLSINAIRAANRVIAPIDMSLFAIDGIERLGDTVDLVAQKYGLDIEINILPTLVDKRTRLCRKFLLGIWEQYGENVLPSLIHSTVRLKEAVCAGQSIIQFDKKSIASKDYQELANEIIRRSTNEKPAVPAETPWLSSRIDVIEQSPTLTAPAVTASTQKSGLQTAYPEKNNGIGKLHRVELTYKNYMTLNLKLAGDFNDWVPDKDVETVQENNTIHKIFFAPAGEYQYRLIIDGKWRSDPTNPDQVLSPLGVHNSMLRVGDKYTIQALVPPTNPSSNNTMDLRHVKNNP